MKKTIQQSSIWVYLAAILLPFNGGFINAATLISFLHNSVGYVTGNIAFAGTYFAVKDYSMFFGMLALILCFIFGAFISGLMIKSESFHKDYRYELNLMIQMTLVLVSIGLLHYQIKYSEFLLSTTLGLQNAMTTHYGTALIRTTHMTGTATDLGVLIAHWFKGKPIQLWKLTLYSTLILFFLMGSIIGALVFSKFQAYGLFVSVGIYSIMIVKEKFNLKTNTRGLFYK